MCLPRYRLSAIAACTHGSQSLAPHVQCAMKFNYNLENTCDNQYYEVQTSCVGLVLMATSLQHPVRATPGLAPPPPPPPICIPHNQLQPSPRDAPCTYGTRVPQLPQPQQRLPDASGARSASTLSATLQGALQYTPWPLRRRHAQLPSGGGLEGGLRLQRRLGGGRGGVGGHRKARACPPSLGTGFASLTLG